MNYSTVDMLALPDEMLLAILNKLNNMDVLYSLIGVNQKLDKLAQDVTFTRSIDLCGYALTLNSLSIDRVLSIGSYPKLHKITLNFPLKMACLYFNDESSFVRIFNHQVSHLIVMINVDSTDKYIPKLSKTIVTTIFKMFLNLIDFHFSWNDHPLYKPESLIDLPSRTWYSSNIVHLNVRVHNFNDCLCLLGGHLSQLHTFIVQVEHIGDTSVVINNTKTVFNLKCFSLFSFWETTEYDNQIVPLLRQMSQLEKLTLSIIVRRQTSFVDGTHLVNDILSEMSYLQMFIFNIITRFVIRNGEVLPTPDDLGRVLIQRGYNVECYSAYSTFNIGQCHIYSLPFTLERMDTYTNTFPGGLFMTVRHFVAYDIWYPFEHEFFVRISQAFPLLKILTIYNTNGQEKKLTHDEHTKTSSIIEFSHLMTLNIAGSSLDYVEQFIFDFYTHLPCLHTLHVNYELLCFATQYFTINAARANCSKVQHIILEPPQETYPENFYLYFPLL